MSFEGRIQTALRTDKGRSRDTNEDSVLEDAEIGLVVLADGMGGHNAGEVASAMAVHTIQERVRGGWDSREVSEPDKEPLPEADLLRHAVENAHHGIRQAADSQPQFQGMGTTVVACLLYNDRILTAHVGDSRLYRLRNGHLSQLTQDHSLVEDLVAKGLYSREEARQNVRRNILTRALGSGDSIAVDVQIEPTQVGDIYLLCSDGLTEMVPDEQISLTLQKFSASVNQSADKLIETANENGGKDNVSVALIRVDQSFRSKSLYQKLKAWI